MGSTNGLYFTVRKELEEWLSVAQWKKTSLREHKLQAKIESLAHSYTDTADGAHGVTKTIKFLLLALESIVVGFLLLFPVMSLFDYMNWPLFHTWGMIHGAFILAWPLLTLTSAALIAFLRRRLKS